MIGTLPPLAKALVSGCFNEFPVPVSLVNRGRIGAVTRGYRRARLLTVEEVDAVVAGYESGMTVYELGRQFGLMSPVDIKWSF